MASRARSARSRRWRKAARTDGRGDVVYERQLMRGLRDLFPRRICSRRTNKSRTDLGLVRHRDPALVVVVVAGGTKWESAMAATKSRCGRGADARSCHSRTRRTCYFGLPMRLRCSGRQSPRGDSARSARVALPMRRRGGADTAVQKQQPMSRGPQRLIWEHRISTCGSIVSRPAASSAAQSAG